MKKALFALSLSTVLLSACITTPPVEQHVVDYMMSQPNVSSSNLSDVDRQEQMFRQRLASSSIGIVRTGDKIRLTMPDTITFDINKAILKPEVKYSLNEMASVLNQYPNSRIHISGHTDSTGNDAINNPLSKRRAASVANYLRNRGVASHRIRATGYGSHRPILPNDTIEGREVNRRVEILVEQ